MSYSQSIMMSKIWEIKLVLCEGLLSIIVPLLKIIGVVFASFRRHGDEEGAMRVQSVLDGIVKKMHDINFQRQVEEKFSKLYQGSNCIYREVYESRLRDV